MPGVARSNVAVTDTFDVWRVRTNEINTSLNLGTQAITANTIVWRDDTGSSVHNGLTANTVDANNVGASTATISINSALAADTAGTVASFKTTGGILATQRSRFLGDVVVSGNLTANGIVILGDTAATDTITATGRFNSTLDTATTVTYDVGESTRLWRNYYGQGINLTGNTTFTADSSLKITAGHLTKPSLKIADALQAGASAKLVDINSNSADTAARDIATITNDNVAAVGATVLHLKSDAGRGLQITSTLGTAASKPSLEITASHATTNAAIVTASSLTSGSALQVTSAAAARTGHLVHIESTATATGATGDTLHVQNDSTANTVYIANFANSTTNVVSIAVGGGVTINGDLDVTGSTTQVRTSAAVVNDKTLTLGTYGDLVTGVTYTQHSTTPVFTTASAHGLTMTSGEGGAAPVVYVVTANTSAVITAETLYTFATVPSTTSFTLVGTINTSSDATGRTITYTGPQKDSNIDDAGIYIPGSSAIHTLKWDDDDNFFEVNDSFKVDTTTQFVLPKGTTAQQPGALTATVAAATTGAMRFNTTASYFEGVNAGTTFEAFATQNFSTAIAVALG